MSAYESRVKQSSIIGTLVLLPPIVLILSLMMLPAGCGSGGGAGPTAVPTQGTLQIGFTDSPSNGFQSILLNVISVRINPSTDGNVSEADPNWIVITAPPGVGAVGELQIDLNQLQNNVKLFNSGVVTAQSYYQLEVEVDPNNPGSIVPTCNKTQPPVIQGCITYGMTFATGSTLKANLTLTNSPIQVTSVGLTPVVIDFSAVNAAGTQPVAPSAPGGNYTISPTITVVPYTGFLGLVKGTVTGTINTGLTVNAELTGTNPIIESATVETGTTPCGTTNGGCFTLALPAAQPSGTAYDFFLSGGDASFYTVSNQVITRGNSSPLSTPMAASTVTTAGTIAGVITNAQFKSPIQAGMVELIYPALPTPTPTPTPAADVTSVGPRDYGVPIPAFTSLNLPTPSVVVTSTATDELGNYTFAAIPSGNYTLRISQSGYDPLSAFVNVNSSTITCYNNPVTPNTCNYELNSTTISGTVSIDAPMSGNLEIMVIAEDSGTTNLENFTMVTIPKGGTSAPFTLTVPTLVSSFDLIASAEDSYQGAAPVSNQGSPLPITGHSIAVLSGVLPETTGNQLGPLNCLGYGSISGSLASPPDSGTTVRLLQDDPNNNPVAIIETQVGASGGSTVGPFSFCVPPNVYVTYQIGRFENATPVASPTVVGAMNTPMPLATSTPCPICGTGTSCPNLCSDTPLGSPL